MKLSRHQLFDSPSPLMLSVKVVDLDPHDLSLNNDNVSVRLNISSATSIADVRGEAAAEINQECDRCLEQFARKIQGHFRIIVTDNSDMTSVASSSDSDVVIFPLEKNQVDISSILLDSIVLGRPMKDICNNDCKGLCAECGINLNQSDCKCENEAFDERWAPLKELKLSTLENEYGTPKKKTI